MAKDTPIWEVEQKYLSGKALDAEDVQIAATALESSAAPEQIIACEALLRGECADELKNRAIQVVQNLCAGALGGHVIVSEALLLVMLLIPEEQFRGNALMERFAYDAVSASDSGWRMNSILLLERLARLGELKAVELLRNAQDDVDDRVRKNASYCLQRLGKD